MKSINSQPPVGPRWGVRLACLLMLGTLVLTLIIILRPVKAPPPAAQTAPADPPAPAPATPSRRSPGPVRRELVSTPAQTAEEIVAGKLSEFASGREEIVAAMARQFNVNVPPDVARFFAAVRAGNWPETTNLFAALKQLRQSSSGEPGLGKLWPAIVETYGTAEQAHLWPAQKLLDYGNAILDSLRPGMVYVGGNDAGRFIPTLLGETRDGEHPIVLTQNGLADGTYLDYVRFQYGDKLNALTSDDSQNAFQTYLTDAQKRLQHDLDFPNEPKQLRPGEDVQSIDGRLQVSGQVAVMAINEQLLKTLLQKNPDLSFALTESFPFSSLYGEAVPLGAITELRATDAASALTPERAAESLDWWRSTTQTLLADPDAAASSTARDAYAKLILGQAGLFEDRKLSAQAESAYQLATSLSPGSPEAVFRYVNLLMQQQRLDEARQIAQTAVNTAPDNEQFRGLLTQLHREK